LYLKLTGGGQACTVTLKPPTMSKVWIMENGTAAALTFTQGSGANVVIPAGDTKVIACTGGSGTAQIVYDVFTDLNLAGTTVVDDLTVSDTALVTGVLTTTAATVSNGGGQFNGAINVGVDDTGYDVKFFGATASAFMQWDASTDDLLLGGASRLGIGTASPSSPLEVSNGTENQRIDFASGVVFLMARNASAYITQEYIANIHKFTGYGDNSSNESMRIDAAGDVKVNVGNLVIGTAGKGIDFAAQTSANSVSGVSTTAELLDHYEEGTWTPTMLQGSNAPAAYAQRTGYYTKVGNLVHLNGRVQLNGLGSMSGTIFMTGLPFTATNATNNFSAFHVGYYAGFALPTATATMMGIVNPNSVNVDLRLGNDVADSSSLTAAHVSADGDFIFSMTYKA